LSYAKNKSKKRRIENKKEADEATKVSKSALNSVFGNMIAISYIPVATEPNTPVAAIKMAKYAKDAGPNIRVRIGVNKIGINCETLAPLKRIKIFWIVDFLI
jgi:hypothetical protein